MQFIVRVGQPSVLCGHPWAAPAACAQLGSGNPSQGWEFPWAQSPLGGSGGTRGDSGLVMRRSLTEMGLKQVDAPFGAPWSLLSWQGLRCGPCSEVLPNHSSQQGNVSGAGARAAFPFSQLCAVVRVFSSSLSRVRGEGWPGNPRAVHRDWRALVAQE